MADEKIIDFAARKAAGTSNDNDNKSTDTVEIKPQNNMISVMKDGKVIQQNVKDVDPQTTVNVQNPKVLELIEKFADEKNNENLTALIDCLKMSRVLVPGKLVEGNEKGDKLPIPLSMSTAEGEIIQPVFTDKEQMKDAPKCEIIMNLPFIVVVSTVLTKGPNISGIGVNPFGKAFILKRELLEKIHEVAQDEVLHVKEVQRIKALHEKEIQELKNPEAVELIKKFAEEKNNENLTALINRLEVSRVLVPCKLAKGKEEGSFVPVPYSLNAQDGEISQPVFTDKDQMEKAPNFQITIVLPFIEVVNIVLSNENNNTSIVVNPFGQAIVLKRELLEQIIKVINAKAEIVKMARSIPNAKQEVVMDEDGNITAKLKMTEEQYIHFERTRFEMGCLPAKLYTEGEEFINKVAEEREEYIDKLFEESYKDVRMYPYLTDEFKVMVMAVSDTLSIVTINMPKRDAGAAIAEVIYLSWDKETKEGRYFAIVGGKKKGTREVVEIVKKAKAVKGPEHLAPKFIGEAPAEGTEISWLMNMLENGDEGEE